MMKIHTYILILILIPLNSCKKEKEQEQPFNSSLLQVILQAKDSLKVKEDEFLSIEFFHSDVKHQLLLRIFSSNCYASAYIDGYVKLGKKTIAIYNLSEDYYEIVNKNSITFFVDTIKGFKDTCLMFVNKKNLFYSIESSDSIVSTTYPFNRFPAYQPLRSPNCKNGVTYEELMYKWFYSDSVLSEKRMKYYRKGFKNSIDNKTMY